MKHRKQGEQIWIEDTTAWTILRKEPRPCDRDDCNNLECKSWNCKQYNGITSWYSECEMKSYINVEKGE